MTYSRTDLRSPGSTTVIFLSHPELPDTIQIASLCASDEDYHTLPLGTVVFTSSAGVHTSKGTSEVQGSEKSCEFFPFKKI